MQRIVRFAGMADKQLKLRVMGWHGSGRQIRPAGLRQSCGIDSIDPIGATYCPIEGEATLCSGTGQAGGRYRLPLRNGAAIGGDDKHGFGIGRMRLGRPMEQSYLLGVGVNRCVPNIGAVH